MKIKPPLVSPRTEFENYDTNCQLTQLNKDLEKEVTRDLEALQAHNRQSNINVQLLPTPEKKHFSLDSYLGLNEHLKSSNLHEYLAPTEAMS